MSEVFFRSLTTPLGPMLIACTRRGVRFAAIDDDVEALHAELRRLVPLAAPRRGVSAEGDLLDTATAAALGALEGDRSTPPPESVPVDLVGTRFQHAIWNAIRAIPAGQTATYTELARSLGSPLAARAILNEAIDEIRGQLDDEISDLSRQLSQMYRDAQQDCCTLTGEQRESNR